MNSEITLKQAEKMARAGNINGVAAFIRDYGAEHDRVTIDIMRENLMAAYIESLDGRMDQYAFSDIKRIANL